MSNRRNAGYASRSTRSNVMSGRTASTTSASEDDIDSDDGSDEDFADNWKAKRAAAKAKAQAQARDPAIESSGGNVNTGVYGFGGAGKGAMQGNYGKITPGSTAGASKEVSVERSSDRVESLSLPLPPSGTLEGAAEECKSPSASASLASTSPTAPRQEADSDASGTPSDAREVWKDVLTPPPPPCYEQNIG